MTTIDTIMLAIRTEIHKYYRVMSVVPWPNTLKQPTGDATIVDMMIKPTITSEALLKFKFITTILEVVVSYISYQTIKVDLANPKTSIESLVWEIHGIITEDQKLTKTLEVTDLATLDEILK